MADLNWDESQAWPVIDLAEAFALGYAQAIEDVRKASEPV